MLQTQEVATAPETQNEAPEVVEQQEVTTPEAEATDQPEAEQPEQPEKTAAEKEVERLRRALTKRDRTQGKLYQELEQTRRQLQAYVPPDDGQREALAPEQVLPFAQQLAQQMREQEQVQSKVQSVLKSGRALEGFDQACNAVNEEVSFYENGRPTPFLEAVMDSEDPAKLLHYLGNNTELAAELSELRPAQIGRRIARIEAQMAAKPQTSAAPKPLQPLSARGTARPVEAKLGDDDLVAAIRNSRFKR